MAIIDEEAELIRHYLAAVKIIIVFVVGEHHALDVAAGAAASLVIKIAIDSAGIPSAILIRRIKVLIVIPRALRAKAKIATV